MDDLTRTTRDPKDEKLSNPDPARTGAVEDVASYVGHKAEDATAYVGHKAEDAASYVGHKAQDAASYVGQKTEDVSAAVGGRLRSLGGTVRERGPEGGMTGEAYSAVANTLESSGRYLEEEGLKVMAQDVTNLIRRNPIPALLIGVAAGYFVGRLTTPRS